jgi:hypothetical protein
MSRFICKLIDEKDNKAYYFEWSTVVDAPVSYGMSLVDFKIYYQNQYGYDGISELSERLKRVEEKGTSSLIDDNIDDLIRCNRAGEREKRLTKKQLINQLKNELIDDFPFGGCIGSPEQLPDITQKDIQNTIDKLTKN